MSSIDAFVRNNLRFAATHSPDRRLTGQPLTRTAVVTCMDARVDPLRALGLQAGDAHIVRNAGGVVTDDVIRSLLVSQRRLGTREVMVVVHTDCGMLALDEDELQAEIHEETGLRPGFDLEAFTDLDEAARESVTRVRRSALLPHRETVRGFVYDVHTGRLREVTIG